MFDFMAEQDASICDGSHLTRREFLPVDPLGAAFLLSSSTPPSPSFAPVHPLQPPDSIHLTAAQGCAGNFGVSTPVWDFILRTTLPADSAPHFICIFPASPTPVWRTPNGVAS